MIFVGWVIDELVERDEKRHVGGHEKSVLFQSLGQCFAQNFFRALIQIAVDVQK